MNKNTTLFSGNLPDAISSETKELKKKMALTLGNPVKVQNKLTQNLYICH